MLATNAHLLVEHESAGGTMLSEVRGSLVVSSLQTLRVLGFFDRYLSLLPKERHESVLFALASSWLPLDLVMAHYGACEAMNLNDHEMNAIGEHVSRRIMGTFLGTLLRSSRHGGAGAGPTTALKHYHRLWDRLLQGGGCTVRATGMKDASIESRGVPMFRYRYFRVAYVGLVKGAGHMFARVFHARVLRASDQAMTIHVSWV